MGLVLARIKDRTLTVASAGMPPFFLYRKATRSVEEIVIKSMPLGGPGVFNYDTRQIALHAGDVLLMVSDGLPELFNPEREILDYPRLKDAVSGEPANGPRQRLCATWLGGGPRDGLTAAPRTMTLRSWW